LPTNADICTQPCDQHDNIVPLPKQWVSASASVDQQQSCQCNNVDGPTAMTAKTPVQQWQR
jgi:hypothetical protein